MQKQDNFKENFIGLAPRIKEVNMEDNLHVFSEMVVMKDNQKMTALNGPSAYETESKYKLNI